MLKNECSRNCWLAAAVTGLLVWIFNGTFFGGLALGLIAFFLMGSALVWLVCTGRGGAAEDAEVLGRETVADNGGDSVLDRAERAVVDASSAFAAGTVAAVAKGREAMQDMRGEAQDSDSDDNDRKRSDDDDDHDDHDDDDSILERAEGRLEKAGDAVKDAMGALAARGKEAISSLKNRGDDEDGDKGDAGPSGQTRASLAADVSPAGQSAVPTDPKDAAPRKPESATGSQIKKDAASKPAAKPKQVKPKADHAEKAGGKTVKAGKKEAPNKVAASAEKAAVQAGAGQDDLKEIKGIGPALEALLHENGVTSFAQIAAWGDTDIDHYADLIGRMGGRIRSDDWVAQAKVLAEGGSTEFSRRVDKGEVY